MFPITRRVPSGRNSNSFPSNDSMIGLHFAMASNPAVDLVLGLMTNLRRGLYAWPALAGAIFVFDEIHAFDDLMFGKLLRFLTELRTLPALLMTASLPSHRLEQLKQTVRRARGEELVEIGGPEELETLPRYFREQILVDDLVNRVEQEMDQPSQRGPGRVLCVCNTVNRAIAFADRCHAAGLTPIIYHSRFRYGDRVQRHKAVIERFRSEDRPALAICTQVAEMSLDLSATLLITDRAPIPALIQHLEGSTDEQELKPTGGDLLLS